MSVDAIVEGVHFRLSDGWSTPAQVGRRALAGALSDLAAMGADAGEVRQRARQRPASDLRGRRPAIAET